MLCVFGGYPIINWVCFDVFKVSFDMLYTFEKKSLDIWSMKSFNHSSSSGSSNPSHHSIIGNMLHIGSK